MTVEEALMAKVIKRNIEMFHCLYIGRRQIRHVIVILKDLFNILIIK